ncbi:MAG: hypothetical protein NVS4B11_00520 [Ktedonobacteraceae bacterium]
MNNIESQSGRTTLDERAMVPAVTNTNVGVETPVEVNNESGLTKISYRVGTYAQFKHTMRARLANPNFPALNALQARTDDDFALALLDAWAMAADVLTFYQERIANESYRRTAQGRDSLIQLGRLVGYTLQPGVASDTYLAFTLENAPGSPDRATIALRTKAQSLPNPGELPQVFETVEQIEARAAWNALRPKLMQPQTLTLDSNLIILKGTSANLQPGNYLLIVVPKPDGKGVDTAFRRIKSVVIDTLAQHTTVTFEEKKPTTSATGGQPTGASKPTTPTPGPPPATSTTPATQPASTLGAAATPPTMEAQSFQGDQRVDDAMIRKLFLHRTVPLSELEAFATVQHISVHDLLANIAALSLQPSGSDMQPSLEPGVYALRVKASLFGYNAPDWRLLPDTLKKIYDPKGNDSSPDWPLPAAPLVLSTGSTTQTATQGQTVAAQNQVDLEHTFPQVLVDSWVVIMWADGSIVVAQIDEVIETSVTGYGQIVKVTRLRLRTTDKAAPASIEDIRQTIVYGQSERLTLADLPITEPVQGGTISVDGVYEGLTAGQTLIITGLRADATNFPAYEIQVLDDIQVDTSYPGGMTVLTLKGNGLANIYKSDTVMINGNVARATQGETVLNEILGSGDASVPYQRFALRQGPLTYVSADTPDATASTLRVYVGNLEWKEVPSFQDQGPRDHVFVSHIEDDGTTTVQFGDGTQGARLPTGEDNVLATYRKGIGHQGLVQAGQISQLMTRTLGIKSVMNPMPPIGGTDPETIEDARNNAARVVQTLNRLVSQQDYEVFARSYVGIAKAQASLLWNGSSEGMFVTVAGIDAQEVTEDSSLYKRLVTAMRRASDRTIPLIVLSFNKLLFKIEAQVKVVLEKPVDEVLTDVEQALHTKYGFNARDFGAGVTANEVKNTIQGVPGVVTVIVNSLYLTGDPATYNEGLDAVTPGKTSDAPASAAVLLMLDPGPVGLRELL